MRGMQNEDSWAEDEFRRRDRDHDGVLTGDEIPDELKNEMVKWDTNKNGSIELDEFKAYVKARNDMRRSQMDDAMNAMRQQQNPNPEDNGDDPGPQKPTIYRKGKLPKELDWFEKMDTDGDNQIGLYEWRKSGRSIKEFKEMDHNGDGFITVEEALLYMNMHKAHPTGDALVANVPGGGDNGAGRIGAFGGPGAGRGNWPQGGGFGNWPGAGAGGNGNWQGMGGGQGFNRGGGDPNGMRGTRGDRGTTDNGNGNTTDGSAPPRDYGKMKNGYGGGGKRPGG
jgi:hypothetical protein